MGQAKQRGTYEERKAQAIKRNEKLKEAMNKARASMRKYDALDSKTGHVARMMALAIGAALAPTTPVTRKEEIAEKIEELNEKFEQVVGGGGP